MEKERAKTLRVWEDAFGVVIGLFGLALSSQDAQTKPLGRSTLPAVS